VRAFISTFDGFARSNSQTKVLTAAGLKRAALSSLVAANVKQEDVVVAAANLRAGEGEPIVLLLYVACPRVEYTDRGKSAVVQPAAARHAAVRSSGGRCSRSTRPCTWR
jgi:hypothetical protein